MFALRFPWLQEEKLKSSENWSKSCQSNICLSSSMKETLNKLENLLAWETQMMK